MANTNTVFGARYLMNPFGGSTAGKLQAFVVPATDHTALFVGDFVSLTGESAIGNYPQLGYLPVVAQSSAGSTQIVGVVEGFGEDPSNLDKIYRPADTLRTVWVRSDPDAWFTIQSTGTVVAGDVGQLAPMVVGSGSTVTGLSGIELNHGSLSSVSGQLRIIGIAPNSKLGTYTKLIIQIVLHAYRVASGV